MEAMTTEKKAKSILREFVCMDRKQLSMLVPDSKKAINRLIRQRVFYPIWDGKYIGIAKLVKPDERLEKALNIMLAVTNPEDQLVYHVSDVFPFQLCFLKNGAPYWVMILYTNELYRTRQESVKQLGKEETLIIGMTDRDDRYSLPELDCRVFGACIKEGKTKVHFFERRQQG